MANLCPGYVGMAKVDGTLIRCNDFNINPSQEFLFYDHVIGLNDTHPTDNSTKGEEVGAIQVQKRIGRPSPISIEGGFTFPATSKSLTSNNFGTLFKHAKYGTYFDISFQYHRGAGAGQSGRTFIDCRINQFSFSVTASDIVNINVSVFAKDMTESGAVSAYTTAEKLITWDKVEINVNGLSTSSGIQGLEFSINNNLQNIYTVTPPQTNVFLPKDIRVGMQEVTGSISIYNIPGQSFITSSTGETTISMVTPGWSTIMHTILKPQQVGGVLGPIITSIPFVGIDKAFGE